MTERSRIPSSFDICDKRLRYPVTRKHRKGRRCLGKACDSNKCICRDCVRPDAAHCTGVIGGVCGAYKQRA